MDDETEVLVRRAVFGKQVEDFLSSDIGLYICLRAKTQADQAIDELKVCNPIEGKQVQALQNKVHVAESIQVWLSQAVQDGLNALGILDSED